MTHVLLENNGLQVDLHSLDNLVSTLACHILSLLFVIIAVATTSSVDDLTSLASCIAAFIP